MRAIFSTLIVALVSTSLAGCFVRTRDHHHHSRGHSHVRSRDCAPAHHWDGRKCVHNGRGKAKAKGHRR